MRDFILTSDNLHLSQVKNGGLEGSVEENPSLNCTDISFTQVGLQALTEAAAELLRHSLAANTERAYESDLRHFRDWGGVLPAPPAMICA